MSLDTKEQYAPSGAPSEQPASEHTLGDKEVEHGNVPAPIDPPADEEKAAAPPKNPWADPSSFPDGGTKAWLTIAGGSACLFVSFGWINCVGVFQEYYSETFLSNYSSSTISWIPTVTVFFMLFLGFAVGKIFDDYGPRPLLLVGTFLHVFGLMMASLATNYYQIFLAQAVCSPIGACCVYYPAFTCASTYFFKKRGQAIGMVAAGSALGGVIFPIMVTHLIPQVGFGWAMRICAFLILALLVFANLTVTSRIPPTKRKFSFAQYYKPLAETPFLLNAVAIFFFYWGMFIPFTFIVEEAISHGMGQQLAYYLVSILNGASIIGRTVPNILADKFVGRFNMMSIMAAFTTVLILAMWIPSTGNVPIIIFAALFGIASGAGIGLTPALIAEISPIQQIGVRSGSVFGIASFAALTGSPIAGQILQNAKGDFRMPAIFSGVSCFIGLCFFIACRISIGGVGLKKV